MFRKLSVALAMALSFGAAGYANAADVMPEPACRDWSGVYIGGHVGYIWANIDVEDGADEETDFNADGIIGGALLGANFQSDCLVFGIEGDIGFADADESHDINVLEDELEVGLDMNGHVRARLGFSSGDIMPFIAAGLAIADVEAEVGSGDDDSNVHFGFTIGAGIDWALSDSFILRAEYLYDNYGSESYEVNTDDLDIDLDSHTVRAALIWNFGHL